MKHLKNTTLRFDTPETIKDRFNSKVDIYETEVSETIPDYYEYLSLMADLIGSQDNKVLKMVDLGCGPGFAAKHIVESIKDKRLQIILVDFADKLLDRAYHSIISLNIEVEPVCCDFRYFDFKKEEFDIIISSLALHHLRPGEKNVFYPKLYSSLKEGGIFLNFDELIESDTATEVVLREKWADFIRRLGWKENDIGNLFKEIFEGEDSPETLESEISLLKKAGFKSVSLIQRKHLFGLIAARK